MRILATIAIVITLMSGPSAAQSCLSQGEVRELVAAGRVIPAVAAMRDAQARAPGAEVTRVDLCRSGGGYVYRITLLRPDGRVVQQEVGAER